jgi:hypothetical protein
MIDCAIAQFGFKQCIALFSQKKRPWNLSMVSSFRPYPDRVLVPCQGLILYLKLIVRLLISYGLYGTNLPMLLSSSE